MSLLISRDFFEVWLLCVLLLSVRDIDIYYGTKKSIHIRLNLCWVDWESHFLTPWHLLLFLLKKSLQSPFIISSYFVLSFCRSNFKTYFGTHLSDNCLSLCFSFHGSDRIITRWSRASRFMYIALNTFGLLAVGGYHFSVTVNGVRWFSTFWSKSTWKHFAYVFFEVSMYTSVHSQSTWL